MLRRLKVREAARLYPATLDMDGWSIHLTSKRELDEKTVEHLLRSLRSKVKPLGVQTVEVTRLAG